ncbi:hypothetical protein [Litoreibacter roseus]|uniref:Uncharacterized protein n=1 Tax=Litoreibacter roseus TaxID=2601869 RepID=A0A6N6JD65_9RHOB|nr:hypothetical protein [Litoreibacter roseus]GFE63142.1 hypothetical protein KIN_02160 [Litoreibacter roseus]
MSSKKLTLLGMLSFCICLVVAFFSFARVWEIDEVYREPNGEIYHIAATEYTIMSALCLMGLAGAAISFFMVFMDFFGMGDDEETE